MKNKKRILTILAVIALLSVSVTTVLAAPLLALHIEVLEWIGSPTPEPFSATGAAVDVGAVCGTGTVEDTLVTSTDTGGPYTMLTVLKHFMCDDLSGTFDVSMKVKLDKATGNTTANWKIIGGTGAYITLKGNGKLVGTANIQTVSIDDVYDGKVH